MQAKIQCKPIYNATVTAIRSTGRMQAELDYVTSSKELKRKKYSAIFTTTTLSCLGRMDISKAGFSYDTKLAIRTLGYGPAAKVAIKFKRAWWIHDLGQYSVKMGGLGHSDLTTRTCVYPSYNIYDDENKTAVLLNSYTWQQDAQRLASLMSTKDDHAEKVKAEHALKELLIRELVRMHKNNDIGEEALYKLISDNYIDHHAFDWYKEPTTAGAFAFFRPQQFSTLWSKMIQPSGDVVVVGEAMSPRHAWVVGALESVIHGIYGWLALRNSDKGEFREVMDILETVEDGNPFVGLPPYMDANTAKWQAIFGRAYPSMSQDGGAEGHEEPHCLAEFLKMSIHS